MKERNPLRNLSLSAKRRVRLTLKISEHTRAYRRSLFFVLFFGALLSSCSGRSNEAAGPAMPAPAEFTFEQYQVDIGIAKHQNVLTGFFLGGTFSDIAVVSTEPERQLRIYEFDDDTWVPRIALSLRPQVLFVDTANIGGRDRLLTYEQGRLNWFEPDSATEHALVEVTTNYNSKANDGIPHIDITRDINGDSLDDLIVPDIDGFWIATQLSNGAFTPPIKLGPPEPFLDEIPLGETRSYRETGLTALTAFWYLSRVHQMDYNQDGRSDIVFWNADHFDVYLQDTRGTFSAAAETFTVDIPFDTDGAYSIAFGFGGESSFSLIFGFRKSTKRKVLHTFEDLNADSVPDLVVHSLEGRSLGKQRSLYEVHFGTRTHDRTVFAQDVSMTIRPGGNAGGLQPWGYSSQWLQDFNGDGNIDILFRDVETGLFGMSRAMVGNSISIALEFYRMENGTYPDKPTTTRKIRPALDFFDAPGVFFPPVLLGDMNGDGRSELLFGKSWQELHVFRGVQGPELLARQPQKVAVLMPNDERNARLVNLNKDNKQDILLHHTSNTGPHWVILLISQ